MVVRRNKSSSFTRSSWSGGGGSSSSASSRRRGRRATILLVCCCWLLIASSSRSKNNSSLFVSAADDDDDGAGGNFLGNWFPCGFWLLAPDGCGFLNFVLIVRSTDDPGAPDCAERCSYLPGLLESDVFACGPCGTSDTVPPPPPPPSPVAPPSTAAPVAPVAPTAPTFSTPAPVEQGGGGDYQITLDLQVRTDFQLYFARAAERWQRVIAGGLADIDMRLEPNLPRPENGDCQYPDVVDDLYVCVYESNIDGAGGTAGFAGVTYIRNANGLPILGYARFEPEDVFQGVQDGWFQNLVIHEFGHALGLGTVWDCPSDLFTNSPRANGEFQRISGCSSTINTEGNAFGPSGDCIHWEKDGCFESEIMTNIVNPNSKLSTITIAALEDMGYDVNYNAADDYTRSDLGSNCVCGGGRKQNRGKQVRHLSALDDGFGDMSSSSSSSPLPKNKERLLSEAGFQDAVAQGRAFLKTMARPPFEGRSDGAQGTYIGDKFVFVYYIENNQVYGVYVEAE